MSEMVNERFATREARRVFSKYDVEGVRALIADGLDLSQPISEVDQWHALHYVLVTLNRSNDDPALLEFLQFLIDEGADVAAVDRNNATALYYAATPQHAGAIRVLVEAGAPVNVTANDKKTPLELAVMGLPPCPECVEILLAAGAGQQTPEWSVATRQFAERRFRRPEHVFMLEIFDRYIPAESGG